jgi:hypothetical protein
MKNKKKIETLRSRSDFYLCMCVGDESDYEKMKSE